MSNQELIEVIERLTQAMEKANKKESKNPLAMAAAVVAMAELAMTQLPRRVFAAKERCD